MITDELTDEPPKPKRQKVWTGSANKLEELLGNFEGVEWTAKDSRHKCAQSIAALPEGNLNSSTVSLSIGDHTKQVSRRNLHQQASTLCVNFLEWEEGEMAAQADRDGSSSNSSSNPTSPTSPSSLPPTLNYDVIHGIVADMKAKILKQAAFKSNIGTATGSQTTFVYLGLSKVCIADLAMNEKADTISLEELALQFDKGGAPSALLTNIIVDETMQESLIKNKQLHDRWKASTLSTSHKYGTFNKLMLNNLMKPLMLYQSVYKGTSSAIKFQNYIDSGIDYFHQDVGLNRCQEPHHPFLYPFFMANKRVRESIEQWIGQNATSPLLGSVNKVKALFMDEESNSEAYANTEEDWTYRLVSSLRLHPLFEEDSPVCLRSFSFGQNIELGEFRRKRFMVPRCVSKLYLFEGLPDIYLLNQSTRIIQCVGRADEAIVPHQFQIDQESGLEESGSSGPSTAPLNVTDTIENTAAFNKVVNKVVIGEAAHGQLPLTYPYDKMGELLANMNCAHNDHIIHQFVTSGKYIIEPFTVTGIFLHKSSGTSKFAMELKPAQSTEQSTCTCFEYCIDHSITPHELLDSCLLCSVLREYADVDLHRTK